MTDLPGNGASNGGAPTAESAPSFSVSAQYIKDLSFENPNVIKIMTQAGGTPEVGFNLGVAANGIGPDAFEVTLTARAEAKRDGLVAFIVELAYAGVFRLSNIPQDQVEPLLFIEAPRLLFPFARVIISDLTRDGGFTPLMLQPIDFVDLYRRKLAERQGQGLAGIPANMDN
jgi:preprotein translocase subunit SecB